MRLSAIHSVSDSIQSCRLLGWQPTKNKHTHIHICRHTDEIVNNSESRKKTINDDLRIYVVVDARVIRPQNACHYVQHVIIASATKCRHMFYEQWNTFEEKSVCWTASVINNKKNMNILIKPPHIRIEIKASEPPKCIQHICIYLYTCEAA